MSGPNIQVIKRKIKSLKIPREYWGIDIDEFFSHQWNMYISIRETAGKTTQSLIFGLVLNSIYPDHYTIEYLRNDTSQTTKANIETIFDTIISLGYIPKIYGGEWNDIIYSSRVKKFQLALRDADGAVIKQAEDAVCTVHSLEQYADFKSSYVVHPKGKYIVLDEFPDTKRATYGIFIELLNVISTIGRPLSPGSADWLHILLMGNNIDPYCYLYDDLMISDQIRNLKFGGKIEFKTEYGTTGVCRLLELGETQKKRLQERNIPFLGFPGKKAAPFTGSQEWGGESYKHIDFTLDYEYCIFRRVYLRHRGRWIQFDVFNDSKRGKFVFAHFASAPAKEDNIIYTLEPENEREVYGFGKYERRQRILKVSKGIMDCFHENRFYYASNMVGSLIDDFIKNII